MNDKTKHRIACAVIAFLFGGSAVTTWGLGWALVFGFSVAMAAGFAKESYDSRKNGTGWDWADIKADFQGALIGTAAVVVACALLFFLIQLVAWVGSPK